MSSKPKKHTNTRPSDPTPTDMTYHIAFGLMANGMEDVMSELRRVTGILTGAKGDTNAELIRHRVLSLKGHRKALLKCADTVKLLVDTIDTL